MYSRDKEVTKTDKLWGYSNSQHVETTSRLLRLVFFFLQLCANKPPVVLLQKSYLPVKIKKKKKKNLLRQPQLDALKIILDNVWFSARMKFCIPLDVARSWPHCWGKSRRCLLGMQTRYQRSLWEGEREVQNRTNKQVNKKHHRNYHLPVVKLTTSWETSAVRSSVLTPS